MGEATQCQIHGMVIFSGLMAELDLNFGKVYIV
jgi:hypothetical protein